MKAIAASWRHTQMLTADDTVYSAGENSVGQLGDGTFNDASLPVKALLP